MLCLRAPLVGPRFTLGYARLWRRKGERALREFHALLEREKERALSRNETAALRATGGSFCIFSTINCTNTRHWRNRRFKAALFLFPAVVSDHELKLSAAAGPESESRPPPPTPEQHVPYAAPAISAAATPSTPPPMPVPVPYRG